MLHWMRDKFSSGRQRFTRVLNRPNDNNTELVSCSNNSDNSKMLVSESEIFSDDHIKLRIIGIEGNIWVIEATNVLPITNLIAMVLGHFYNPTDSSKIESNYTLISVSLKRELNPASTVQDEGLSDYDEILLVEKYIPKPPEQDNMSNATSRENDTQNVPSEKQIYAATKHLQSKNKKYIPMPEDCSDNFQFEIRKVLITLIEASANVLSTMPNCKEIFEEISSRIGRKTEPDKTAIDKIMSLGFSEAQAIRALQMKRNKVDEALEWLIENAEKVKEHQMTESLPGPSRPSDDPIFIITQLLDYFRETRIKTFEPDDDILQGMVEMGFPAEECINALRITGNSKSSAYEWLIGERKMSVQDIDTGLDTEEPIYKALMKNPTIQLGLYNPKILLAFLAILDNPTNANIWLNDPETKPILNQVFKIYHSEKHILLVNNHVRQYLSAS